jgi:hypothetical protein
VKEKSYFVDEQPLGSYAMAPQALFEATENGNKMTDVVHYVPCLWVFIGRIMNTLV